MHWFFPWHEWRDQVVQNFRSCIAQGCWHDFQNQCQRVLGLRWGHQSRTSSVLFRVIQRKLELSDLQQETPNFSLWAGSSAPAQSVWTQWGWSLLFHPIVSFLWRALHKAATFPWKLGIEPTRVMFSGNSFLVQKMRKDWAWRKQAMGGVVRLHYYRAQASCTLFWCNRNQSLVVPNLQGIRNAWKLGMLENWNKQ